MKKNHLLALLLAVAMMAGCSRSEPISLDERIDQSTNEGAETTYEGIIESIQIDSRQPGTHALNLGDRSILIQSRTIDLNRYVNKEVEATGNNAQTIGNAQPVVNVTKIRLLGQDLSQVVEYESPASHFRLEHPQSWELRKEEKKLTFLSGQESLGSISIFDVENLEAFAQSREVDEGDRVTVAAQPSLRFNDSVSFRVYVPLPPLKKAYLISFSQEALRDKAVKDAFYQMTESFQLIYDSSGQVTGEACGGAERLTCPENFVCELSSGEENAEGICVSIDDQNKACAFISPPTECDLYHVAQYSPGGCPQSYKCAEGSSALKPEGSNEPIKQDEEQAQEEALESPEAEEEQPEETTQPAEQTQDITPQEQGEPEEEREYTIPSVDSVTGSFEVKQRAFSFQFPKFWHYWSFGPLNGTHWTVGLSDKQMEGPEDALVYLSIVEKGEAAIGGEYRATKSRNADTEYVVEGPADLEQVIDAILASIMAVEAESE